MGHQDGNDEKKMEVREYQRELVRKIKDCIGNVIVLLDQGLGKTVIGLEVARNFLQSDGGDKGILIIFRNKNVKNTWFENIVEMKLNHLGFTTMVGVGWVKRYKWWNKARSQNEKFNVIITSETLSTDIERGVVDLQDFGLIIIDEAAKIAAESFDGYRQSDPFRFLKHLNRQKVLLLLPSSCEEKRLKKIKKLTQSKVVTLSEKSSKEIEKFKPKIRKKVIEIKDPLLSDIDKCIGKFLAFKYFGICKLTNIDFSKVNMSLWREKIGRLTRNLSENEKDNLWYNFKVVEELNRARYYLFYNKFDSALELFGNARERTHDRIYLKLLDQLIYLTPKLETKKLQKVTEITKKYVQEGKKVIIYSQFLPIARGLHRRFASSSLLTGGMELDINEVNSSNVLVMTSAGGESLNLGQFNAIVYVSFPRKLHTRSQINGRIRRGTKKDIKDEVFVVYRETSEWKNMSRGGS